MRHDDRAATAGAAAILRRRGSASGAIAYQASTLTVTQWNRTERMDDAWAASGINVSVQIVDGHC